MVGYEHDRLEGNRDHGAIASDLRGAGSAIPQGDCAETENAKRAAKARRQADAPLQGDGSARRRNQAMTIDITTPERIRCLRETVSLYADLTPEQRETWLEKLRRDCALSEHGPVEVLAVAEAITDPAKAAELIRRLVERAGVKVIEHGVTSGDPDFPYVSIADRAELLYVSFGMKRAVVLVPRLLALAPGAGADAVLAALRGES